MDWVADGIAIGSRRDALEPVLLRNAGIAAVLQLLAPDEEPLAFPFVPTIRRLLVSDGEPLAPETLQDGVAFIGEQRSLERPVLVTCGAGQSRSPIFVAAYLHERGMDLLDAFCSMMRRRPRIMPHPELLRSLIACYQLPETAEALLEPLARLRRELEQRG